jgi:hypothetical protein
MDKSIDLIVPFRVLFHISRFSVFRLWNGKKIINININNLLCKQKLFLYKIFDTDTLNIFFYKNHQSTKKKILVIRLNKIIFKNFFF